MKGVATSSKLWYFPRKFWGIYKNGAHHSLMLSVSHKGLCQWEERGHRLGHKTLFSFWWARWAWRASWRQANMIRRREARCVSKTRKWRSTDEQVCWLARYSFQNFGKKCCLSDKREALTNRYVNSDFALLSDRRCSKMPLVFETAISPTHTYTMFVFENYYLSLYLYL